MARKAKIVREQKIEKMIEKYSSKRRELLSVWNDSSLSLEKRREARVALSRLPKNSNPNRHRNRCSLTGRPRGYYRKFGLSSIALREMANNGLIPGIKKASW